MYLVRRHCQEISQVTINPDGLKIYRKKFNHQGLVLGTPYKATAYLLVSPLQMAGRKKCNTKMEKLQFLSFPQEKEIM
jgi:hypothetical protein